MNIIPIILIALVALEHLYICFIEMFAWEKLGNKIVPAASKDFLKKTEGVMGNQGLYNAFLAAGLIWSLFITNATWSLNVGIFFLGCVIIAGIYGAFRSSKSILFKQALPAILALITLILFH